MLYIQNVHIQELLELTKALFTTLENFQKTLSKENYLVQGQTCICDHLFIHAFFHSDGFDQSLTFELQTCRMFNACLCNVTKKGSVFHYYSMWRVNLSVSYYLHKACWGLWSRLPWSLWCHCFGDLSLRCLQESSQEQKSDLLAEKIDFTKTRFEQKLWKSELRQHRCVM